MNPALINRKKSKGGKRTFLYYTPSRSGRRHRKKGEGWGLRHAEEETIFPSPPNDKGGEPDKRKKGRGRRLEKKGISSIPTSEKREKMKWKRLSLPASNHEMGEKNESSLSSLYQKCSGSEGIRDVNLHSSSRKEREKKERRRRRLLYFIPLIVGKKRKEGGTETDEGGV